MKACTFFLLGVIGLGAHATEVAWVTVTHHLTYKGRGTYCKTSGYGRSFYVSVEIENGVPSRVVMSNYPKIPPYLAIYKAIELTKKQAASIELFRDARGKYWLKKLPLSGDLLKWVLFVPGQREGACRFPKALATVIPGAGDYHFETDDLDEGILVSYSQKLNFTGKDVENADFEASLYLKQREYRP